MPNKKRKSPRQTKTIKRKRSSVRLLDKQKIISMAEQGISNSEIAKSIQMPRTTVITILKNKEHILSEIKKIDSPRATYVRKRASLVAQMEGRLIIWINDQVNRHVPLSLALIQAKAKSLFEDMKVNRAGGSQDKVETFQASKGWFNRFKHRFNLHSISVQGEAASADKEAASEFPTILSKIIEENGYCPQQIFNVDETGLFWKKMPERAYISKEEKTMPGFKAAKDRLTLLLGSNASGDFKLKPLLVYRAENPRALKGIQKKDLPVIWKSNPKAWVTGSIFHDWFKENFIPAVKHFLQSKNLASKVLLLLDNAPGHPKSIMDLDPDIKVVFLPPNTTALLQPMDQGVIASFKAYYLRRTFAQAIEKTDVENGPSLKDFWKQYNVYDAVINIGAAWDEVKQSNLRGVWKKLCPQFRDATPNIESLAEIEDVVNMANKLNLNLSIEDIGELIGESQELTNEDLLNLVSESESESSGVEEVVTDKPTLTTVVLKKVFGCFEEGMDLLEKNDPDFERSSQVISAMKRAYAP